MLESDIQRAIRTALNADGRVRLIRNSTGFDLEAKVRYGLGVGGPDLIGVLRDGRAFFIEVKRPGQRLRPEQEAWHRAARAWNVRGGTATSVAEAMALLEEACKT